MAINFLAFDLNQESTTTFFSRNF
ncbi:uncharacterized protein METZ01_LOCUS480608 [marine metagenome]|uniref:Uncharacterized protein n=1 Tax=marine metagenome TaxID=408172 RepID=A0A383C6E1_9ZZZZ